MGNITLAKLLKELIVLILLSTSTTVAMAHSSNEKNPYIVHRQGIYQVAGGHMFALKSILMLNHPAKADVTYHAKGILEAFKHHGNAFPKGSKKGKTHAKREIWTDSEKFKQRGQETGKAIMKLIDASENSHDKAIKMAFMHLGKSCKNCHDDFRKKSD